MRTRCILGTKIDLGLTMKDTVDEIRTLLDKAGSHYVSTTNPEFVIQASKDPEFQGILNKAALSLPDGIGVLYACEYKEMVERFKRDLFLVPKALLSGFWVGLFGRWLVGERVTGVELVHALSKMASEENRTIFLLGGWPKDMFGRSIENPDTDMADVVSDKLSKLYPNIQIIGATSQFSYKKEDDASTVDYIHTCMRKHNVSQVDFLFVAYNYVEQMKWITRNASKIPAKVSVGVGGTFDYISGSKRYAPTIVRRLHLEWLYRLVTQPWRLGRVFVAFPLFPLLIFLDSLKRSKE